jgi:NAD(P)-dependent dehydrogenase (short-subunit alcohol dehydrogenase family)
MLEQKWGRVVAITSVYAQISAGKPWFNVAKVAQRTLIQNLARTKEFSRNGITFNSIAPGAIYIPDTGWATMKSDNPNEFDKFQESLPLGRLGLPEEVAKLVGFICSPGASYVNGSSIVADGGESCEFN